MLTEATIQTIREALVVARDYWEDAELYGYPEKVAAADAALAELATLAAGEWEPLPDGEYKIGKTKLTISGSLLESWTLHRFGGELDSIDVGEFRLCRAIPARTGEPAP